MALKSTPHVYTAASTVTGIREACGHGGAGVAARVGDPRATNRTGGGARLRYILTPLLLRAGPSSWLSSRCRPPGRHTCLYVPAAAARGDALGLSCRRPEAEVCMETDGVNLTVFVVMKYLAYTNSIQYFIRTLST